MTVETAADRALMLADFGVDAIFDTPDTSHKTIKGVFDNDYEAVNAGGTMDFAITRPRFYCRSSDVLDVEEGDDLEIEKVSYKIRVVMPDGTGMTELMLEKQ
mgnify:FL=1